MKKVYLCIGVILCVVNSLSAQFIQTYSDDANRGTGLNQFNYVGGGWVNAANTTDPYYLNTVSYSNQVNNSATVNFGGSSISLYGAKASHHGIVGISIDNQPEVMVDLYAATRQNSFKIFGIALPQGNHTLKIRVTGTKNAASSGTYIVVDYIIVNFKTSFAAGLLALNSDQRTDANTAVGVQALTSDVEGNNNTAIGFRSLFSNVGTVGPYATGVYNTAVGSYSLYYNQGTFNTAVGTQAMKENTSGRENSAFGVNSLLNNREGNQNTAIGTASLRRNGSGSYNVAVGYGSMYENFSGNGNVAIGANTLPSLEAGNFNTVIGYGAGIVTGNPLENSTLIGKGASGTGSNQVRLGNSDVTSIGGQVSWSTLSDGRFKKDIKEDVSGLEFIEKLRPVSYIVDKEAVNKFLRIPDSLQSKSVESKKKLVRHTGFVAQEVEAVVKKTGYVFSGVEAPQNESDHYSIRYAEFVVPLVKAMQELSVTVKEQKSEIDALKEELSTYRGTVNDKLISNSETILYQNNPNPFSADTEIKMALPETATHAAIRVYNLEGKELRSIRIESRGNSTVKIAGSDLQAGMYLYALIVDGKVIDTKRMILTK